MKLQDYFKITFNVVNDTQSYVNNKKHIYTKNNKNWDYWMKISIFDVVVIKCGDSIYPRLRPEKFSSSY